MGKTWAVRARVPKARVSRQRQANPQGAGKKEGESCHLGAHGQSGRTPDPAQPKEGSTCWKAVTGTI